MVCRPFKNMEIQYYKSNDLIMAEYNPRQLTKDQYSQLKDSIKRFGLVDPLIVNKNKERKNILVGGHQRFKIAKEMGIDKIPCVEVDLTLDAEKELNIRLNKNVGEWDYDALANYFDVGELTDWGFSNDELQFYEEEPVQGLIDDDEIPEVEEAITKEGDLWILGEHRVLCGDSTKKEDVDLLMDGKKADMVFTSPPYNANTKVGNGSIFNKKNSKKLYSEGYKDNLSDSDYIKFAKAVLENCFMLTDGFIFWNVSYNSKSKFSYIEQIQDRIGFLIEQVCWKKSSTIPFKGCLMREWEPIYIFSTNKQNLGVKKVTGNYWEINNRYSQQENHKACFPVQLPEKGISLVSVNSGVILDPFLGSGSTLIAAEKTNRKCYGMELDPNYCDVIVKRWEDFTGKKAERIERVEG